MKAIGSRKYLPVSNPDSLIAFETATPVPGAADLVVEIKAVSVNPVDTKIRKSLGDNDLNPPRILGFDAAGVVVAIGHEATGFSVDDEVFYSGDVNRQGCNSEFHLVDFRLAARKPRSFSFVESAAIPLVALTAWELLFEQMGVDSDGADGGKSLLIINGAGGVGSALIPLAVSAGLEVIATASRPETREWCKSLGAHHVLNHREPLRPQTEALGFNEFPYIANLYDTELYWESTADLLAPRGTLGLIVDTQNPVHIGNPFRLKSPRIVWEYMATRSRFQTADRHRQGQILVEIATRCDAGHFPKINTREFSGISAESLREAHAAMERSSAFGKWVLEAPF